MPKKRSPAARLDQSRVPQKSFLFLLEEKEIARQIKKCEENFFAEQRAKRAAAGRSVQNSQSGFSSKKVRISSNKHHQIELAASLGASPLASAGRFARKLKGFLKSTSSRPAARRRFEPIFFFRQRRKAKRDFIKLSVWRFLFFNYN
ncbi:hypothetical protein HY798_04280 [Candidatus Falkowbacteria bacterium]|nr:hypothetical protein [Candidatus Falkowbacteria bacterium]